MPLGKRQLFAYWRTDRAGLANAQRATCALQARLRARHPGLVGRLYVRDEPSQPYATLMETYALESMHPEAGIDLSLQRDIDDLAAVTLLPWLRGLRHVEVFEECTDRLGDPMLPHSQPHPTP